MVLYEVTLDVDEDLSSDVEEHMRQSHIPAIVATKCFRRIRFARSSARRFRTSYEAADQADLDRYLRNYAPDLRTEFSEAFPRGVTLSRETWILQEVWDEVLS